MVEDVDSIQTYTPRAKSVCMSPQFDPHLNNTDLHRSILGYLLSANRMHKWVTDNVVVHGVVNAEKNGHLRKVSSRF
jgi:hypothetical protein